MSNNIIEIKKIIEIKSFNEAWLRSIAAQLDYALSAIDGGCEELGMDVLIRLRSYLPDPTQQDVEDFRDAYCNILENE